MNTNDLGILRLDSTGYNVNVDDCSVEDCERIDCEGVDCIQCG